MIFGENLLALLVLALGAALAVGNLLALVRPRPVATGDEGEFLDRPPLGRSVLMILLGALAAIWALASLASGNDDPTEATFAHPTPALVDTNIG